MKRSYTFEVRHHVLSVLRRLREVPELADYNAEQLRALAAGSDHRPSTDTIRRWEREALTKEQSQQRLHERGRHTKLTSEQRELVLGYD